jgi:hypothetical protein
MRVHRTALLAWHRDEYRRHARRLAAPAGTSAITYASISRGELPIRPVWAGPHVVYHCTDVGDLLGVLEGKRLWTSDVWFMNDACEARYELDAMGRAQRGLEPAGECHTLAGTLAWQYG